MNDMNQVRGLARAGLAIAALGALASLGWPAAVLFDHSLLARTLPAGLAATAGDFVPLFLIGLVPAGLFLCAMIEAFMLFRLLGEGLAFTTAVPRRLARLGLWAAVSAAAGLATPTLLGLAATLDAPEGQRQLVLQVGSGEITALVIALLLFAFARIMRQAIEIAQENREIV